jgi:hypothetical protein
LSYSHHTGHFAREDIHRPIDESNIMMKIDPYNYLDERNAIMLNVKNPATFIKAYEKAIENHFKK